jgi:hypothetical protein
MAVLTAYGLTSTQFVQPGIVVHVLNFIGACGIAACAYYKSDYPPLALNVIWAVFAASALLRAMRRDAHRGPAANRTA